ncbi:hypothetical protein [Clostridium sp.]|nr:hypothetical protein [Clostridium sp.]MDR3595777.1 hypothetical protein [Clostridium sp.]
MIERINSGIIEAGIVRTQGLEPTIFCNNDDARTTILWAMAGA